MVQYRRLPVMLHAINSEGVLVDVNKEWCVRMEYTAEEVIGRRSTEFLTEESCYRATNCILPFFFEQGFVRNVPYEFVTKSGAVLEVELSAELVRNEAGYMLESRAVIIDVTERNKALRELIKYDIPEARQILGSLGILK